MPTTAFYPQEVLSAHPDRTPVVRLSPFETRHLKEIHELAATHPAPAPPWIPYLGGPFAHEQLTADGRSALRLALETLTLGRDDEVWIVTTGATSYVSGCVTRTIDSVCRWSMEESDRTAALLLIHQFGYPADVPAMRRPYPLIEDCAYAFFSAGEGAGVGARGDLVFYSFPKAFPLAYGGLLRSQRPIVGTNRLTPDGERMLRGCLAAHVPKASDFARRRVANHEWYARRFGEMGMCPLYPLPPRTIPSVFLFELADAARADRLKQAVQDRGIECTVFYGGGGFLIPCHQELDIAGLRYVADVVFDQLEHA